MVDIFLQPSRTFVDLKESPTLWLRLLPVALASGAMVLMYNMKVDAQWFVKDMLLGSGGDSSSAGMRKSMLDVRTMGCIGAPSAIAVTSSRRGLDLTCWANMSALLVASSAC